MSSVSVEAQSSGGLAAPDPRRWRALAVLGLIQFMLVLDTTVVNVALPAIQRELGFSGSGLAWVVTGYVLMAGGLLLLGGRLADIFGRRRLFLLGVGLFGVASALCGAAVSPAMLVVSRFAQGVGQALATPAALGLITLLFPDMRERFKALGIWGGIAGLAGTCGPIISGLLTDTVSWRWIFFINLPIVVFALLVAPRLVTESRMAHDGGRIDLPGAALATGGLIAVVYGLLAAAAHPWVSVPVLLPLLGGVALLVLMVAVEARTAAPLIPLRFFTNRTRVTANVVTLLLAAAFFTFFFLYSLFTQQVLDWSPLVTGLASLPFALTITMGVTLSTKLMPRFGVKPVLVVAFLGATVAMLLFGTIDPDTGYLTGLLPGLVIFGLCFGSCFPATTNAAMHEVTGQNAGLASGVQTTMQQIGGAIGLAALVTLALRYAAGETGRGILPDVAATDGYALAFRIAAVVLACCAVLVLLLLKNIKPRSRKG